MPSLWYAMFVHDNVVKSSTMRLSISETAKLFGIDARTVRRALKNEELRYIVVRGRYKILFESALKWSQKKVTVRNKSNVNGIGQYVERWKISNKLYSPNPPKEAPNKKE